MQQCYLKNVRNLFLRRKGSIGSCHLPKKSDIDKVLFNASCCSSGSKAWCIILLKSRTWSFAALRALLLKHFRAIEMKNLPLKNTGIHNCLKNGILKAQQSPLKTALENVRDWYMDIITICYQNFISVEFWFERTADLMKIWYTFSVLLESHKCWNYHGKATQDLRLN